MWLPMLIKWSIPSVLNFPKCKSWVVRIARFPKRGCLITCSMCLGVFCWSLSWTCFQATRMEFHNGDGDGWKCLVKKNQAMDGGCFFKSLPFGWVCNVRHQMNCLIPRFFWDELATKMCPTMDNLLVD